MARGITEQDVHTAADELVAAGERPTIERIRAHLGTGSPNTVMRWLETWWQALGGRLEAHRERLVVPEAPDTVAALAGQWWELALEHARASAVDALAADRTDLLKDREALCTERENFRADAAALRAQVEEAEHARHLAVAQAAELQRLVQQLEERVEEVTRDRDASLAREMQATVARQAAEGRIQELQDTSRSERERLALHVQAVENRAHAKVDRARQEAKDALRRLAEITKDCETVQRSLMRAAETASSKTVEAEREASSQRARADALENQLAQLRDLPAALEAAWHHKEAPLKARKTAKRATRAPRKSR